MRRKLTYAAGGALAALLLATLAYSQLRERRLIGVVLTPERVTLAAGGTQQFRASGLVSTGDTVAVKTGYRATGGVITAGGLYTAGPVPGTYEVIATLYDDDYEVLQLDWDDDDEVERGDDDDDEIRLADTATVTVTGTGTSGPGLQGGLLPKPSVAPALQYKWAAALRGDRRMCTSTIELTIRRHSYMLRSTPNGACDGQA